MPDESCRKCGWELSDDKTCRKCLSKKWIKQEDVTE